jgi:hypothetical protein
MLNVVLIYIFKKKVAEGWTSSSLYSSFMNVVLFFVLAIICECLNKIMKQLKSGPLYHIVDETSSTALVGLPDKKNVEV